MSWKRILKAARKLGTPVIIADESGNDPFVVMTLAKYEDLVEENVLLENAGLRGEEFGGDSEDDIRALDPRLEKVFEEQFVAGMQDLAQQKEKIPEVTVMESLSEERESPKTKGEMPLEDRFYFEPLDDEFKK